jgi:glycerol-3-phosphate O-acyltransferase
MLSKQSLITYSKESVSELYQQALALNKFSERGSLVCASLPQAVQLTYYRNNIVHLFVIHALICNSVRYLQWKNKKVTEESIIQISEIIYPFLVAEYFLDNKTSAKSVLKTALQQLCDIGALVISQGEVKVSDNSLLKVFVGHLRETYQRYQQSIILLLSYLDCNSAVDWQLIDRVDYQKHCKKQLSTINIEPFDLKVNEVFLDSLEKQYPRFIDQKSGKLLMDLFYN